MAIMAKRGIKLFKSKHSVSHELFFNVFELVLAVIVILSLVAFVNGVVENSLFEKNYLSRDIAVLANTILASPGDLDYDYRENTGEFLLIFDIKGSVIEVDDKIGLTTEPAYFEDKALHGQENKELGVPVFYPFGEDKNIAFEYGIIESDKGALNVRFSKTASRLDVNQLAYDGSFVQNDEK